ncbi:DEAD-box ATP-dependent RNA helicase 16 [Carex littledalei]|uniref:RNA helicase n=1 Tax=Carex littledalei TaxID=544730 RepID=A0A833VCI6_9POAL|nr:DEAD-box ATP-dependent RNA helicase 16 [Carex littledalei]
MGGLPEGKLTGQGEEQRKEGDGLEEEQDVSFDTLGLDEQLSRALRKKGITVATPIQREAIPLILEGKDVVARAKTGSGKTLAYLLPMFHSLLKLCFEKHATKASPNVFILVPTRELCQQVYQEASSLLEFCTEKLKLVQLTASMPPREMRISLAGPPNIVVTTPACISTCISKGILKASSIKDSLSMLILDEADLLLSYGYEKDLKVLTPHIPRSCQCILMSATSSTDVETLKKLLLHNPVTLTLSEVGSSKDEIIPSSVQQFWISCSALDKQLYMLALLKLELVQKKVLIFVNTIDMAFRIRLFLEKFGIKSAVLNAELPQNSRIHILEEFNAGLFDYLIATDDSHSKEKEQMNKENKSKSRNSRRRLKQNLDSEFGVVRGIDFKNVYTVVNFDMPQTAAGYVHRVGRTGRAHNTGTSVSLISPEEEEILEEIKSVLEADKKELSEIIAPFPLLNKNAVESLRYRAQDVARSVTSRDVQDARRQDLKNEILNSQKLKAHFLENPRDLDLLKHDKLLSSKVIPAHLKEIPEYLVDPTTKEASQIVKLTRAAMGIDNGPKKKHRPGFRKGSGKTSDPLRTFSAESGKRRGGKRRKEGDGDESRRRKRRPKKTS